MLKFVKNFLLLFLLTFLAYPRPTCNWTHSGKNCFPMPTGPAYLIMFPLQALFGELVIEYFLLEIATVTAITLTTLGLYRIFKKKKLLLWLIAALLWSIPYLYYGYFISPTGFIE